VWRLLVAAGLVAASAGAVSALGRWGSRTPGIQRFFARRGGPLAAAVLCFLVLAALLAPALTPYSPTSQPDIVGLQNAAPSWQHPLGTDFYSRDLLSRVLFGARVSLMIGVTAMALAVTLGVLVGATAGYAGGIVDAVLMRLVDVALGIPRIFIVLVVVALWERLSFGALILLLGLTGWFATSRLVRAEVRTLKSGNVIAAARALGASPVRIVLRHALPNIPAPIIVSATMGVANVILVEAGLSYLGFGVRAPTPSWGNIIYDGASHLTTAPWTTVFPGLAIALTVMALNILGDAVRDALDPRWEAPA
jgi:peptide/nickel transport system permease protein